jgi:hypothetical protein
VPRFQSSLILALPLVMMPACTGSSDEEAVEQSRVWSGWNYTWEKLSHRVSLIKAVMEEDGTGSLGLVGGDWSTGSSAASDSGLYRLRFQEVQSDDMAVIHGSTEIIVGPAPDATESVTVDAASLAGLSEYSVVLRGFSINTDTEQTADYPLWDESSDTGYDPALGYCTQGFGFSVGEVTMTGDQASFDVEAHLRWAPNGEDDPIDRTDMNEAIPFAQTAVTVAWTLVGFNGSEQRSNLTGSVDYAHGAYSDQPPLTGDEIGLALDSGQGIAGLVSFDLGVEVTTDPNQGEYLRSFGVEVLDKASNDAPIDVETEATNSSLIETASIRFSPTIELAWFLLDSEPTVSHQVLEGLHEVGYVQVDSAGVIEID